jgi:hypothetical protein
MRNLAPSDRISQLAVVFVTIVVSWASDEAVELAEEY